MDFPHIKDTQFPHADNIDVYKYQNVFDYARWTGKISFKLLNVLWNSNYADVPHFDTVSKRDEWFDEQRGYVGTLESLFNNTPENTIKIPIPYNDAYNYNYLVVDMPMQTSEMQPINYEDKNIRVKRWFYFIEDMIQTAPSTTELKISVDYWTTFIHSVEIPYLMLERGHAPMMQTTVDEFLSNPIQNNEYLLADDFNYGRESIIKTSIYKPIGNGTKYVLFAAPYSSQQFNQFGGTAYNGNSTPPTYSNTQERWGFQIQVDDYEWKYGDSDYSNSNLPISNRIQDGLFNGCECFAIKGEYAFDFFNDCAKNCVNFIHGIQAMFILDESLFTIENSFTFRNKTIYTVKRKHNIDNLILNKQLFGFDTKYREITKLYTFPYSELEITDDEGNVFTARIENCGSVQIHTEVSLMFPYLNYNVFVSGINGDGTIPYTWKRVQDTEANHDMWASDFSKFMMNWNVPTYSIYVSAENEYAANHFFDNYARRLRAIKDYKNPVRFANTTYENTDDSFTTATANVNRTTTKDVANTAAIQAGLKQNKDDTNDNATLKIDTYLDGGTITTISGSGGYIANTYDAQMNKLSSDADVDRILLAEQTVLTNNNMVASSIINSAGSIGGGITSGAISGATLAGPEGALAGGVAGGLAQAVSTGMGTLVAFTQTANLATVLDRAILDKFDNARANLINLSNAQIQYNGDCKDADNALRDSIVNRFSNPDGINNTNASRTKTAQDANATATQTTETNNADYTRDATIEAEKANLVQKQIDVENEYKNARLNPPVTYSKYSGDFMPDAYQRRGLRINVRTQPKSVIAQTGDAFLRFGYALHRAWDMSRGFHYCKNFTFWKAEDIWINDGSGVANVATNVIGNILLKGVTVWRDPSKIGTVGIYDNI